MPTAIDLTRPYGATARGFTGKNAFADQARLLNTAEVVFDVGTHTGEEASTYRQMFPAAAIHCFEPTPARATALRAAFNDDPRVSIHTCALHRFNGTAVFRQYAADNANSLYAFDSRAGEFIEEQYLAASGEVNVETRTLDSIIADLGLSRIDVLKVDVQGAEDDVFAGGKQLLSSQSVRLIFTELLFVPVYAQQANAEDLIAFLHKSGYRLYDFYNFAHQPSGQLLWGDAIFLSEEEVRRQPPASAELTAPIEPLRDEAAKQIRRENEQLRATVARLQTRLSIAAEKTSELRQRLRARNEKIQKLKSKLSS
jgi:FkbM family methyltransferase